MKIQKQTIGTRKNLILALILTFVLLGLIFTYFYLNAEKSNNTSNGYENASMDRLESDEGQTQDLQDNLNDKNTAPNTDHPATPDTSTDSDKKQVPMVASVDQSDDTVFIRGGVNYPVTDGSCYALLSGPLGQSIRIDSTILSNPGSTDCKTISIATNELAAGTWTFMLHYTSNEFEGVSSEISFSI